MKSEPFGKSFVLWVFFPSYFMAIGHFRLSKTSCVNFDHLYFSQGKDALHQGVQKPLALQEKYKLKLSFFLLLFEI